MVKKIYYIHSTLLSQGPFNIGSIIIFIFNSLYWNAPFEVHWETAMRIWQESKGWKLMRTRLVKDWWDGVWINTIMDAEEKLSGVTKQENICVTL